MHTYKCQSCILHFIWSQTMWCVPWPESFHHALPDMSCLLRSCMLTADQQEHLLHSQYSCPPCDCASLQLHLCSHLSGFVLKTVQVALRWFCSRSLLKAEGLTKELIDRIPGKQTDRKTPLGELNWIFTAITDSIAWNMLPRSLFQRLFRQVGAAPSIPLSMSTVS